MGSGWNFESVKADRAIDRARGCRTARTLRKDTSDRILVTRGSQSRQLPAPPLTGPPNSMEVPRDEQSSSAIARSHDPSGTPARGVRRRARRSASRPNPPDTRVAGIDVDATTIPELQALMDAHRLKSVQLTQFYLHRIRKLNPTLNAVITVSPTALADARAADAARRHGDRPTAPRHPDHRQGQHRHHRHAHDGRFLGARRQHARRRVHRPAAQGRRRIDHRQGQPVRVGELPVRIRRRAAGAGSAARRTWPTSSIAIPAARAPAPASSRPLTSRSPPSAPRPMARSSAPRARTRRRHQADARAAEPGRHRPDLGRPGHRGADRPQRDRRRGAARRDDRRGPRRSGDGRAGRPRLHRLHAVPRRRTRSRAPASASGARAPTTRRRRSPRSRDHGRHDRGARGGRGDHRRPGRHPVRATARTPSSRRCSASSRPTSPRTCRPTPAPAIPRRSRT